MKVSTAVTDILIKLFNSLPVNIRNFLFQIVLGYFPIRLIQRIPCSYATYLKCYFPRKGDVVIDCGAHIGNCAILFSRCVGKRGLVVALEPFLESYQILKNRSQASNRRNIIAFNKGIWNETGKFFLRSHPNSLSCRIEKTFNPAVPRDNYVPIDCITIDDLIGELGLGRVDMIKMDIEGTEIEALQGAETTLARFRPHIAVASYHQRQGKPSCQQVEKMLQERGYAAHTFFPPHLTTCGQKE